MVGFIRPEAAAALRRWREALAGVATAALGLWWATLGGLLFILGAGLIVAGIALTWVGVQRGRFRTPDGGPGTVQVIEGQISYFGPLTGGMVALDALERLIFDPSLHPAHWKLSPANADPLHIPMNAAGAEALFDAFAALPGLRLQALLQVLHHPPAHPVVIWERQPDAPAGALLH